VLYVHMHVYACVSVCMHTHTRARAHTHTHTHTHMPASVRARTYTERARIPAWTMGSHLPDAHMRVQRAKSRSRSPKRHAYTTAAAAAAAAAATMRTTRTIRTQLTYARSCSRLAVSHVSRAHSSTHTQGRRRAEPWRAQRDGRRARSPGSGAPCGAARQSRPAA